MSGDIDTLTNTIKNCTLCETTLPHTPRPVFQVGDRAKILIIGQAPGIKAHESATPWNDNSGDKLRSWLGVDKVQFYSTDNFTHLPMAFCFPGYKNGADAPPPKICATTWHARVMALLTPRLTLFIGRYSQQYYLPQFPTLTEAVQATTRAPGSCYALPHPSGRNNRWQTRNPWFQSHTLPMLKSSVMQALGE